ncbi:MAG: MmcQ/YjbR family DNA-binding protein [Spirochaetaceae bacterium]|jgi:predicted DNA-binding protein (MmcQ/YjbR family)|nr:MmcQ/YjbR family DNA-binding protein [Spirochaetaceae bacterium]
MDSSMGTLRQVIDFCLTLPEVYEDYPFGEGTALMRHTTTRRGFALIMLVRGEPCVNLKCDPEKAAFLRGLYTGVIPGYHMNKRHWNTIRLGSDVGDEELKDMILHSYDVTKKKN